MCGGSQAGLHDEGGARGELLHYPDIEDEAAPEEVPHVLNWGAAPAEAAPGCGRTCLRDGLGGRAQMLRAHS